ncbi:hypothetical protein P7C70_g7110, partial [Phenoliferia sp. Uapishka_3]
MSSTQTDRRSSGSRLSAGPSNSTSIPNKSRTSTAKKTEVSEKPNDQVGDTDQSNIDAAEPSSSAATDSEPLIQEEKTRTEPPAKSRERASSISSLEEVKEKASPALQRILQFADNDEYVGMTYERKTRPTRESDNHDEEDESWIKMERGRDTYREKGKGRVRSKSSPPPRGRRASDMGAIGIGANDRLDASQIRGVVANRFSALEEEGEESETEGQPENDRNSKTTQSQSHNAAEAPDDGPSDGSDDEGSADDHREPLRRPILPSQSRRARQSIPHREQVEYLVPPSSYNAKDAGKGLTRLPEPQKYSGRDKDPLTLKKWARGARTWLQVGMVPEESYLAPPFIASILEGPARDWFDRSVVDVLQESYPKDLSQAGNIRSPWPLNRVIKEFEKRFVSQTAHRDAQAEWSRITMKTSKGKWRTVGEQALYIEEVGEKRYSTYPIELKIKLIETIPGEISNKILEEMEIESGDVEWSDVVALAIKYERTYNQRSAQRYARENGIKFSAYEAATNSGQLERIMRRQREDEDSKGSKRTSDRRGGRTNDSRRKDSRREDSSRDEPRREKKEHQRTDKPPRKEYTAEEKAAYWEKKQAERKAAGGSGKPKTGQFSAMNFDPSGELYLDDEEFDALLWESNDQPLVFPGDDESSHWESDWSSDDVEMTDTEKQLSTDKDMPGLEQIVSSEGEISENETDYFSAADELTDNESTQAQPATSQAPVPTSPAYDYGSDFSTSSGETVQTDFSHSFGLTQDVPLHLRPSHIARPTGPANTDYNEEEAQRMKDMLENEGKYRQYNPNGEFTRLNKIDRDNAWGWIMSKGDLTELDYQAIAQNHHTLGYLQQQELLTEDDFFEHKCNKFCLHYVPWLEKLPSKRIKIRTYGQVNFERDKIALPPPAELNALNNDSSANEEEIDFEDENSPAVIMDITIAGKENYSAFVDTGASNEIVPAYLPRQCKLRVHRYKTPKILKLGTKGSRAMINGYCYVPIEIGLVRTTAKADIANVGFDIILGRTFLRRHKAVIELGNPDKITFHDVAGSARPRTRRHSRSAHLSAIHQNHARQEASTSSSTGPRSPDHPKEREKTTPIPVFKPSNPNGHEDDDNYEPTKADKLEFTEWVLKTFRNILVSDSDELPLPPKRDVEHEIPYIDESDPPRPRVSYKIPDKHLSKWEELREKHVSAGLWIPATSRNADPMMPVTKKDGKLRPVVDLRRRNANTVKLSMPLVDADQIRSVLAAHRFHFELDVKGCFQQLRTRDADVWKSAFQIMGQTFVAPTAQQGDCNSGVTQGLMMSYIFDDLIGRILMTYADNIFGFADTWRDLRHNVSKTLTRCQIHDWHINMNSVKICPEQVTVLGMKVAYGVISMETAMKDAILMMRTPHDKKSLQQFMGSVEWLARFIPHLAEIASPLTDLTGGADWKWTRAHDKAASEIKTIVEQNRVLTVIRDDLLAPEGTQPIHLISPPDDPDSIINPAEGDYIFLQGDASSGGTGSVVTVGKNWWSAKLVNAHSRKFTPAQQNYPVHDQEIQAILEGFAKNESQLLGREVIVLTDNKSLEAFMTSKQLTPRQARVYDFLSKFKFTIKYIKGEYNFLPDTLSRQFEGLPPSDPNDLESVPDLEDDFAASFMMLGRQHSTLNSVSSRTRNRQSPQPATHIAPTSRDATSSMQPKQPTKPAKKAPRQQSSPQPADSPSPEATPARPARPQRTHRLPGRFQHPDIAVDPPQVHTDGTNTAKAAPKPRQGGRKTQRETKQERVLRLREPEGWNFPTNDVTELDAEFEGELKASIRANYAADKFFKKVIDNVKYYASFEFHDGLLWHIDAEHGERLCIPTGLIRSQSIKEVILDHFHELSGHVAAPNLIGQIQRNCWWPGLTKDPIKFYRSCPSCQACKKYMTLPYGKLHSMRIPGKPYEELGIDFQGPFPEAEWHGQRVNFICNFIDLLTGEVISVPCQATISAEGVAEIYLTWAFPHFGVPLGLSCDRDV